LKNTESPEAHVFTPQTFLAALLLIVVSMLCWGSWPNLLKALPGWRLEYFYFDYTFGFLVTVFVWGATLGPHGSAGGGFLTQLADAGGREAGSAFLGGLLWNMGNILLLNAIMIAGLAVAFPVASVLAVILGVGIGYWSQPIGNTTWLVAAVAVLALAAFANAAAYRNLSQVSGPGTVRGLVLSLAAGILVGSFPPFIGRAITGPDALDAYRVTTFFALGASIATFVGMPLLLTKPLIGDQGTLQGYFTGKPLSHIFGLLAGAIWCTGTVANFASAGLVGVAISWGIGSGAPMVGALWGIFLWKEFKGASRKANVLIIISMVLYIVGVVMVANSYRSG
jgi:glucose uptake protein